MIIGFLGVCVITSAYLHLLPDVPEVYLARNLERY